jgi:hypothetical protein
MALPSSGPLTLAQIQGEFGGSNPISLSEYYAGGGLVPAGTSGTYGAVPSSGTISIRNFYGTSAVVFVPNIQTFAGASSSGSTANSNYVVLVTDGTGGLSDQQSGPTFNQWGTPAPTSGVGSGYECYFQIISQSGFVSFFTDGGGFNTWVSINTNRYAGFEKAVFNSSYGTCTIRVIVRKAGTTSPTYQCDFSMSVFG